MQLRNLLQSEEDRAVSPVIGVILMVAITVILAAVIGTFVLGLGDQVQETSPNTQWSWSLTDDPSDNSVSLTHDGGDSVNAEQLSLRGDPLDDSGGADFDDLTTTGDSPTFDDDRVTAGDSLTIDGDSELDGEGQIRLVWTSDGGGQSSTLSRYNYEP